MGTGRELWTQQGERICLLIAHSMLHLFGYDHMEEEERKIWKTSGRDFDKDEIYKR